MAYIFDLNDIHNTTLDWRLVLKASLSVALGGFQLVCVTLGERASL